MTFKRVLAATLLAGLISGTAHATPVLQVHAQDGIAVDTATDEDSWLSQTSDTVTLDLMGNYSTGVESITDAALVVTVEDWAEVTMEWVYGAYSGSIDLFTSDYWFDDNEQLAFWLTDDQNHFNNHSPYGSAYDVVDLYAIPLDDLVAGMGTFSQMEVVADCNATLAGETECADGNPNQLGEVKTMEVTLSGVDWAHFDLIAVLNDADSYSFDGIYQYSTGYGINPGSHDSSWTRCSTDCPTTEVPEPPVAWLLLAGLLGMFARRKAIRS